MQVEILAENWNLSRSYATLSVSIGPGKRSIDMARYGTWIQDKKTEKQLFCPVCTQMFKVVLCAGVLKRGVVYIIRNYTPQLPLL
jgi:hypothetical protein